MICLLLKGVLEDLAQQAHNMKRDWIMEQYVKENLVQKNEQEYYLENGNFVFTEHYLKKRNECCGNKCRHCPFEPKHTTGNTNLRDIYK